MNTRCVLTLTCMDSVLLNSEVEAEIS